MEETLELISLNVWHIIAAILNLLILTLIIKKFLFERVKKVLADRQAEVDNIYKKADTAAAVAEQNKAEYTAKLEQADDEAENIVKTATQRAERLSDEIVSDANKRAAAAIKKADEEIEQSKKKAVNDIKNEIAGISVDIAEKVVGREINEKDHEKIIDSFIDNL